MMGVIPRQIRACEVAGISPLFGIEMYVQDKHVSKEEMYRLSPEDRKEASYSYHLLAIAQNEVGYRNLVQLCSWGWLNGFYKKPRVTHEQLIKHREGIVFSSCCYIGEIGQAFDRGGPEAADAMIEKYMAMFPGQFYLEFMLLDFHKQKRYDEYIMRAHRKYGLPLLVTQDCHYVEKGDSKIQQYMLMIRNDSTIKDVLLKAETGEDVFELQDTNLWMKSEEEINEKWAADYADVVPLELFTQAKKNTVEVARKCKGVQLDRSVKLPHIPDADEKLKEALIQGFKWRGLVGKKRYMLRLREEMELICRKGFASYFLIEKQMVDEARRVAPAIMGWDASDEAVGPGRGSAGGSLACYCLGITNVDPIRHDLLFSRFLNENRGGRRLKTRFTGPPLPEPLEAQ
jgi:DNA polymerase-3 subunit alpha